MMKTKLIEDFFRLENETKTILDLLRIIERIKFEFSRLSAGVDFLVIED